MTFLTDFSQSYFGTMGLAQQYQANKIANEQQQINLQNMKMKQQQQQQIGQALQKLYQDTSAPVGQEKQSLEDMFKQEVTERVKEAEIYRKYGDVDHAHKIMQDVKGDILNRVRETRMSSEDTTQVLYGVKDPESYQTAIATLAEKYPDKLDKFVNAARQQGIDPSTYSRGAHALMKQFFQSEKSQAGQAKLQETTMYHQQEEDRKRQEAKDRREARIQSLQLRAAERQDRIEARAERKAEREAKEAQKVSPADKQKQTQLNDLNKQSTAMNARFAKEWTALQNLYSTDKIGVTEFNRRRDEMEKTQQREARALANKIKLLGFSPVGGQMGTAPTQSGGVIKLD